jgi:MFS family permease
MNTPTSAPPLRIPAGVWVLGFVSMLMDISSEMIHSLLPLFLVGTLGVSVMAVGLIEGIAESTALISKVFSGALSDYLGRRKGLAVLGYAMGAFTKPVFAMATGVGAVVAARFVDRVTPCWPTSRRPAFAVRPLACASRWTPWAPLPGPCWPRA